MEIGNWSLKSGKMKVTGDAGDGISVCTWDRDEILMEVDSREKEGEGQEGVGGCR